MLSFFFFSPLIFLLIYCFFQLKSLNYSFFFSISNGFVVLIAVMSLRMWTRVSDLVIKRQYLKTNPWLSELSQRSFYWIYFIFLLRRDISDFLLWILGFVWRFWLILCVHYQFEWINSVPLDIMARARNWRNCGDPDLWLY